ncbi:MAG: DUF1841 family protein [Gammaproteobacteria bacterium]|nr:DUF1841 family protein [Gammaproteobacteria bacterium]
MFFSNDRSKLRQAYFDIWQKTIKKQPLEPMEKLISVVISEHPEYHAMFANKKALDKEFFAENEANPFMHMGLHLAIREQLSTNRPEILATCYNALCEKHTNSHDAEHQIMQCLTEMLWNAQQNNAAPDEQAYIRCLKKLAAINF